MFSPRLRQDRRIFFPWEGRGGARRFVSMGRFVPLIAIACLAIGVSWLLARERYAAGERRTRVVLTAVRPAVERYLLEKEGACPRSLSDVTPYLKSPSSILDAWGRPLRLVCPSGRPGVEYVLMSDGPDGAAGGRDRIEY